MVKDFMQDPQGMRRQGDVDRAASAPAYEQAKGDPEWEAEFENMFGKAANPFRMYVRQYLADRSIGYTTIGDGRNTMGDSRYAAADAFETTDAEGGAQVRRAMPEA
ncbi:hypothetical protein OIE68_19940 [Nocardia vinacea]|uniref:hypothetical protein n=1 Tax=Nocardia vinacea TaxID=96468 RepID=UPI002E0EF8EC|nr:hypothetical protein OIE68_19940 [Nocardia vinacea]